MQQPFTLEAPGRICLFGEHQDYLGLGVIACGTSLRMRIEAQPDRERSNLALHMPDIDSRLELDPAKPGEYTDKRDYLRACLRVVKALGTPVPGGWTFRLTSAIPVNAGCGSSSVMCVTWCAALLQCADALAGRDPGELARLANRAEVEEFGESGGIMDHLAAARGGLFHLDCLPPYACTPLPAKLRGLVLIHSGEPKDTTGIIHQVKGMALAALDRARKLKPDFDLARASIGEALQVALELPPPYDRVLRGNVQGRMLCESGLALLQKENPDLTRLGNHLNELHQVLADDIGISTDRINKLLQVAREAGALGGKVNGSGGGGTCFVLAPDREGAVVAAIQKQGAQAWPVEVGPGLRHA